MTFSQPRLHPPKDLLIAVIGATGTGKSKLAVELATRFNGEIINGDAMQMYQGLPIITNKITEHERNGIPHHLLDFIDLHEQPWTVKNFVIESQKVIREIRSRGKLPILVGGTHYYTHALLFKEGGMMGGGFEDDGLADGGVGEREAVEGDENSHQKPEWELLQAPTEEIYAKLQEVDPLMARRWHPRDRRHIQRSLEIWLRTGRKASDTYGEQKKNDIHGHPPEPERLNGELDPSYEAAGMRYTSLVFWLEAQDKVLKERLNARVDDMVANGLVQEAASMADLALEMQAKGLPADKSKGIWVSIGYKELETFLETSRAGSVNKKELASRRQSALDAIQASTRQYAKRQNRYIRIRFANAIAEAGISDRLFLLDCTDLDQWNTAVTKLSREILDRFLKGESLPDPSDLSEMARSSLFSIRESQGKPESFQTRTCEVCNKTLMTEKEWEGHQKSRGHRRALEGRRKGAENEARREASRIREGDSDSLG